MTKRRLFLAMATIAGSHMAAGGTAHAAVGLALLPGTVGIAAMGVPDSCEPVVRPAFGTTSGAVAALDATGASKMQAILGGKVSQLELIARQQAGGGGTQLMAAADPLPGTDLSPSAGGTTCQRFALPSAIAPAVQPGLREVPLASDEFLASKRLPVKRTAFDSAWNRVRHSGVSQRLASSLVRDIPGPASAATLAAVNSWTNARVRYVEDSAGYGRADYWADASRTLRRGAGDCEDIAIAKMQLLAALGVPSSDMYLTIARDLVRNADHALLVVTLGERNWLLDNATDQVLDASQSYDYRPILSFSGTNRWLHGYRTASAGDFVN